MTASLFYPEMVQSNRKCMNCKYKFSFIPGVKSNLGQTVPELHREILKSTLTSFFSRHVFLSMY